jgi:hypothetical protein
MSKKEDQGYRVKTAQPVCGNCKYVIKAAIQCGGDTCGVSGFTVNGYLGTCKRHEWQK